VLGISSFLCVHCFLAKRNKSDREENDKVKNKNWKEGDGSECFMPQRSHARELQLSAIEKWGDKTERYNREIKQRNKTEK
jgi:hypothetical protein